jgi:hypothetical protein
MEFNSFLGDKKVETTTIINLFCRNRTEKKHMESAVALQFGISITTPLVVCVWNRQYSSNIPQILSEDIPLLHFVAFFHLKTKVEFFVLDLDAGTPLQLLNIPASCCMSAKVPLSTFEKNWWSQKMDRDPQSVEDPVTWKIFSSCLGYR